MSQKIQAYFKNENEAEKAAASLKTGKVSNILVDKIPDAEALKEIYLVPANHGGAGAGAPAPVGFTGKSKRNLSLNKNESFTHIVECETEEEDKDEALEILKETDGYIDEKLLEK